MPRMMRTDYVTNSNDSYWLSNPKQPLEGFARIIGDERAERTPRTRIGLLMTQARIEGSDRLGPPGFTRQDMQDMVFSNRQYAGELTRDAAVQMCRSFPGGNAPSSSGSVPVGNACDVLAAWDLHENLDSSGAILFRRFIGRVLAANSSPWSTPFDPEDPVNTPRDLNTGNPEVQRAFGDALADLNGASIPLDASIGQVQVTTRGDRKVPIHGGPGGNGQFNAISARFVGGKGFEDVEHGSSFVQVVGWNSRSACPDARTILTYSQSTDPTSRHYGDQTELFSRKRWVRGLFCRRDVLRGTKSTTDLVRGKKTRVGRRR
jgi:acyl-homoserine-lactone acylase